MHTYTVEQRSLPPVLRRRKKILGLRVGAKQDYQLKWVLKKDGLQIGVFATEQEARAAIP